VVRTKQFIMKPMTMEEAVLQMDLVGHDFFFFLNSATDKQSVLYRRRDGRLGLIEPA
jgi:putative sigma-54 modulation protein